MFFSTFGLNTKMLFIQCIIFILIQSSVVPIVHHSSNILRNRNLSNFYRYSHAKNWTIVTVSYCSTYFMWVSQHDWVGTGKNILNTFFPRGSLKSKVALAKQKHLWSRWSNNFKRESTGEQAWLKACISASLPQSCIKKSKVRGKKSLVFVCVKPEKY